jgi:hypothetical protein
MGTMTFLLPANLNAEAASELERSWVAACPEQIPWPTQVQVELDRLIVQRQVTESGTLVVPWSIAGAGRVMTTSGTLIERPQPYQLLLELARGKLNQVRSQAVQWREEGLLLPTPAEELIRSAGRAFCQAVATESTADVNQAAQLSLELSYQAADALVSRYINQVMKPRPQRPPRRETTWGCRVRTVPTDEQAASLLAGTFDSIGLEFPWSSIEPSPNRYDWSQPDAVLDWAERHGLAVTGGPLIDFSAAQLPEWLGAWERDLTNLSKFLSSYVTAALQRYRGRIRRWQVTSAGNTASVLSLSEHELLWLTIKVARVAQQVDSGLELVIGVAQPWCDYLARANHEQSPFLLAEVAMRDLKLATLDLELIMGVTPRGSYCRDLLDTSRLLDSYAELGLPLRVTLGYPSARSVDLKADPQFCVDAGYWHDGIQENAQAGWAAGCAMLASCKPSVEAVSWIHFSDAEPHQFPHCGLLDAAGNAKPSLQALRQLR